MRLRGLLFLLMLAGSAFAGEFAILSSGARLYVDRHEADSSTIRLYHGTGVVELASTAVRGFEAEEYAAPVAAAPSVGAALGTAPGAPAGTGTAPGAPPAALSPASPRELADAAAD